MLMNIAYVCRVFDYVYIMYNFVRRAYVFLCLVLIICTDMM